jgi:stringent starvation protein B
VDAAPAEVSVPEQYVKDGQIVLNISPTAVMDLSISNDAVAFNGRFGGVATDIFVPVTAVIGIYARENGQGMVFEPEEEPETTPPDDTPPEPNKPEGRPSLKIVK